MVETFGLAILLEACVFLRISYPRDVDAYLGMASECHPVWKQFALRRFGAGDSAHKLLGRFPPTRRLEFGRYGVYSFRTRPPDSIPFTSLSVVTRDGMLLSAQAGSCTWRFTFFWTQDLELDRQYAAFMQEHHRMAEQQRLKRLESDLQKFHVQYDRWPTNEAEFSWFVTGEKPPAATLSETESPAAAAFKARYRLEDRPLENGPPVNALGITLKPQHDGAMVISLIGEDGLTRTVPKPTKSSLEMP